MSAEGVDKGPEGAGVSPEICRSTSRHAFERGRIEGARGRELVKNEHKTET